MTKEFICPNCGDTFHQHHQRGPNPPWCQRCTEKRYRKKTMHEKMAELEAENARLRAALERLEECEKELAGSQ